MEACLTLSLLLLCVPGNEKSRLHTLYLASYDKEAYENKYPIFQNKQFYKVHICPNQEVIS